MGNYVPGFISSITVNGVAGTSVVNSGRTAQHCEIWRVSLPAGSGVVPIVVTFPGATQGCAVSTYVTYPSSPVPVDALGTNNKVSTLTLTDLAKTAGGFGVFITCSNVSGKDCHVTMTGETVTKGCNSLHSAGSKSYQFYLMNPVATTSATGDPVATWSGSSPVAFVGATWY